MSTCVTSADALPDTVNVVVAGGAMSWIVFAAPLGVVIVVKVPDVAPAAGVRVVDAANNPAIVSRRSDGADIEAPKAALDRRLPAPILTATRT
jgi:hypothetical protein